MGMRDGSIVGGEEQPPVQFDLNGGRYQSPLVLLVHGRHLIILRRSSNRCGTIASRVECSRLCRQAVHSFAAGFVRLPRSRNSITEIKLTPHSAYHVAQAERSQRYVYGTTGLDRDELLRNRTNT
ncbi:hypothetical protein EVAR_24479_1 [Eumeta japonica]|uniref:Uncharacterized protein n=1 Tax=Eumeta variegata TaxID=151549 RepID=A0A4C1WWJ7_EUMVA|nr:hypothetical protein EVAR_24479_1 [Eumeta japonica]